MPRAARIAPGGFVYHVLNRSAGRFKMFRRDGDYEAFGKIMLEAHQRVPLRILSYCVLSTHWHFVVWPRKDGELTDFFRWLAHTHAMRWRVAHNTVGYGAFYQGRFKSFPVQSDEHLTAACRYVERNALSAGLVTRAEQWKWGSMWVREHGSEAQRSILSDWPLARPEDWADWVNIPITEKELERFELSLKRGAPFGDEKWATRTAMRLKLNHTLRPEGRPAKAPPK
jgi:putative transposase